MRSSRLRGNLDRTGRMSNNGRTGEGRTTKADLKCGQKKARVNPCRSRREEAMCPSQAHSAPAERPVPPRANIACQRPTVVAQPPSHQVAPPELARVLERPSSRPQPQRGDLFIAMRPPQAHSAPAERPVPPSEHPVASVGRGRPAPRPPGRSSGAWLALSARCYKQAAPPELGSRCLHGAINRSLLRSWRAFWSGLRPGPSPSGAPCL